MSTVHSSGTVEYRQIGDTHYRIGDDGSVWSRYHRGTGEIVETWRCLNLILKNNRYFCVTIYINGKLIQRYVHHLVLETFVGPRPEGMFGCHNDGNPINNRLDNLRWDYPAGNSADMVKHGNSAKGSRNGNSKLTEEVVRSIRLMYSNGIKQTEIGRTFGVTQVLVSQIVLRKIWKHVT